MFGTELRGAISGMAGSWAEQGLPTATLLGEHRMCRGAGGHMQNHAAELARRRGQGVLVCGGWPFGIGFAAFSLEATESCRKWVVDLLLRKVLCRLGLGNCQELPLEQVQQTKSLFFSSNSWFVGYNIIETY